jgi:uncharacterized protein YcfJ
MKKTFVIITLLLLIGSPALAADNAKVQDFYKTITKQIPITTQVCRTVEVPIYEATTTFDENGAVIGGVVGGVVGNQVGKGRGKQAATGIGAIVGAIVGGKKQQNNIVGYRQEQHCDNQTTYNTETYEEYDYSTVEFTENGKTYRLRFNK